MTVFSEQHLNMGLLSVRVQPSFVPFAFKAFKHYDSLKILVKIKLLTRTTLTTCSHLTRNQLHSLRCIKSETGLARPLPLPESCHERRKVLASSSSNWHTRSSHSKRLMTFKMSNSWKVSMKNVHSSQHYNTVLTVCWTQLAAATTYQEDSGNICYCTVLQTTDQLAAPTTWQNFSQTHKLCQCQRNAITRN